MGRLAFDVSLEDGTYLVRLARRAIETNLRTGETLRPKEAAERLRRPCGAFVTLNSVEGDHPHLRGCIGLPLPVMPLDEAVVDAAISAATRDPRFEPVTEEEMGSVAVEVSVLTPPSVVRVERPDQYPHRIETGRDGLIVRHGPRSGLLLPQVAVEWGWDAEEFLTQCCLKAWLPPDAWLLEETEVSTFQAIIFAEEAPRGPVRPVKT